MNLEKPNIILHEYYQRDLKFGIIEAIPEFRGLENYEDDSDILHISKDGSLYWQKLPEILPGNNISIKNIKGNIIIDSSINLNFFEKDKFIDTEIYYKNGQIGIGRSPLYSYKFDIAVPKNTLMTSFHIGDGEFGFSMGNGTSQGFIPEIIGMGSDENDAGLYLLGKSGNGIESSIPLIVIDGRNNLNQPLKNRPILGVTSGDYSNYKFIIDQNGKVGIGKIPEIYKMEIEGSIQAHDFIIDGMSIKALINVIREQQEEIDKLKNNLSQ